jgi:ABC-type arginine/histidine transport system permease subunit
MAVRKSWMMYTRKSSNIVARFFVALVTTTTFSHQMFLLIYMLQNADWIKKICRMEKRKLTQS